MVSLLRTTTAIVSIKDCSPATIKHHVEKTSSINKPHIKVQNKVKNYECFRVSLNVSTCMHRTLSFPISKGQNVPVAVKETSDKLLSPAMAQA